MFGKKEGAATPGRIDSLIGADTRVEGNIRFSGGLRIDGQVVGNVEGEGGTLIVSEQALIQGEVRVQHLVINGRIEGRVSAHETLEMESRARITGDVDYRIIEMHPGAVIQGQLMHRAADAGGEPNATGSA